MNSIVVVVIGGSAGALGPLQQVVSDFPADLPAAVFVTTHVPADSVSAMPHILSRSGPLFATHAIDGAPIAPGRIVVAPPNYHLIIEYDIMRAVDWAKENGQRPSIDVPFRSAVTSYANHACGVLLSGTLDDGVAGLRLIRNSGGLAIAQDPEEALFPEMPRNAVIAGAAQTTAPASAIGALVTQAVRDMHEQPHRGDPSRTATSDERQDGRPSMFTCPDCGGTLWESDESGDLRFRCRTGHAYNVNAIASAQSENLENSLWSALRVIEERVDLLRRMAWRARERGDKRTAERYMRHADDLQKDHDRLNETLGDVVRQRRMSAS